MYQTLYKSLYVTIQGMIKEANPDPEWEETKVGNFLPSGCRSLGGMVLNKGIGFCFCCCQVGHLAATVVTVVTHPVGP